MRYSHVVVVRYVLFDHFDDGHLNLLDQVLHFVDTFAHVLRHVEHLRRLLGGEVRRHRQHLGIILHQRLRLPDRRVPVAAFALVRAACELLCVLVDLAAGIVLLNCAELATLGRRAILVVEAGGVTTMAV